jgi:hypothetical protein
MYSAVHTFSYVQYKYVHVLFNPIRANNCTYICKGTGSRKRIYGRAVEEKREKNYEEQGQLERGK